jgi:hypothetical protein
MLYGYFLFEKNLLNPCFYYDDNFFFQSDPKKKYANKQFY